MIHPPLSDAPDVIRVQTINYQAVDISPRGLGFLCTRDLPVGDQFNFTIMLPHPWDADRIAAYVMKREPEIIGLIRGH